ncbi:MAG: glutamate formiminotransferase, partial [Chloroflexota bacterium]|nr:glutamate formiminotransferase [Chloroflexota bacterium]
MTVQAIARAAAGNGVRLLDVHLDADHNRSVLTLTGAPDALVAAAFAAIDRAVALIDINSHEGVHPRIGVVDVVPFAPVAGVSREVCVLAARALGQRVGEELGIPVYLYEWAAIVPEHENLADVRRKYADHRSRDEPLTPDHGPPHPHPRA